MIMTGFAVAVAALILAALALVLLGRTAVAVALSDGAVTVTVTTGGNGVVYDSARGQRGLIIGRFRHFFRTPTSKTEPKSKPKMKKADGAKRRGLPWSVWLAIGRAGFLFMARVLARLRFDEHRFLWQPVMDNPAAAGMAYGAGQAVYGIFPGLAKAIDIRPGFGPGQSHWEAKLAISVANRQIFFLLCRFIWELPIKGIIKNFIHKRGVK